MIPPADIATESATGSASATALDVTIGIDFGTSSAKMAFRELGNRNSILIPAPDGRYFWPTQVHLCDGCFYFLAKPEGKSVVTVRWLKMLLAETETGVMDPTRREMMQLVTKTGCSVECLATLMIAYLISRAREQVRNYFEGRGYPTLHFTYNMAAPLETFDPADVEGREHGNSKEDAFLRALFRAEKLVDFLPLEAGWAFEDAKETYDLVAERYSEVPPMSERQVFVVPETHAAVTGAVFSNFLADGHYAVVDIGAGTTDVAVFCHNRHARKDNRWAVTYFADAVSHEASTQADACIADVIKRRMHAEGMEELPWVELRELARQAKEISNSNGVKFYGKFVLTEEDFQQAVQELSERLFVHYKRTFLTAILRKTKTGHQYPFSLLLLGGGSRFGPFRLRLSQQPDKSYPKLQPTVATISFRDRMRVLLNGTTTPLVGDDDHLFSIAHGLTVHIVRSPKYWHPSQVDNFDPAPVDYSLYMRDDDT